MTDRRDVKWHLKDQYKSLRSLVEGITVDSLAVFDLETCKEDEPVKQVLRRMNQMDIDQVPVDPGRTYYVVRQDLEQMDRWSAICEAPLRFLTPPELVAAGTSLAEVYPLFQERTFLFVLQGTRVEGIVTPGDFQRAPFRMYLFGLLGLLEMGVVHLVLDVYGDEDWQMLPEAQKAREEAERWYKRAKRHGEEPRSKFEVASLASKLHVIKNAERVLQRFDEDERQLILTLDLKAVKTLRDNLAHAKDLTYGLPGRWGQVCRLAKHLERLTGVIAR